MLSFGRGHVFWLGGLIEVFELSRGPLQWAPAGPSYGGTHSEGPAIYLIYHIGFL